ncbi:MAG: 50S ribosomal protein L23 [Patescibacteria group bacterium]
MATTKEKKNTKEKKEAAVVAKKGASHPLILGPRITEKGAIGAEKGIYTFNVKENANKNEIKKAITMLYGVTPVRISITQVTDKVVFRGGAWGTKHGGKKAVVHLKKGDKITFA